MKRMNKQNKEDRLTLRELKKISKILLLAHGKQLDAELGRIATTDDRKRVWVLIDGKLDPEGISKQSGLSVGSVRNFLTVLEKAELVENPYGKPPVKLIDYVPPKWIGLLNVVEAGNTRKSEKSNSESEGSDRKSAEEM